jgi:uncharacterized membrane protein YeaQ/YmgE (transglycosylase-associated protein family)
VVEAGQLGLRGTEFRLNDCARAITREQSPFDNKAGTARETHMGGLIWNLVIGLVIGAVAKFVMPGNQGGGIVMTTILGVVGAMVAAFVGQGLGWYGPGQAAGFIASVVGAILVLWLYGKFFGKKGGA